MKTKVDKALTLMMTAIFILLTYIGFAMMYEVGVGYLWLAMYTVGTHGLAYQAFSYFVDRATEYNN
jgi:hypothetical protein